MTLPDHIVDYLRSYYLVWRQPVCLLVNDQYRLQQKWDSGDQQNLSDLKAGVDVLDRLPFLHGQLGPDAAVIPFLTTGDGDTFEVHIVPHRNQYYVLLLNVQREHDFQQERQQITNDVRLLHANQQRLVRRQRELISDLVEAKTELDHRRREAERNNASKSRFIAMMSHEFRTPLASIINYADLALEPDTSAHNMQKSAEAITRASRHLRSLVDNVLDDARLEAGQVQLSERAFTVHALIDDLTTIMAPLAAEKGLAFAAYVAESVPPSVKADDVRLRQILINLLGNAVKFTEQGGVRLDVAWDDGILTSAVSDTGPGIDLADQERIFRVFERGETDGGGARGAGLGLAISLNLARLMRGQILLDSEGGSGCRFAVSIPAPGAAHAEMAATVLPSPSDEHHAERPASILLCDDDEDMLALSEYYLHRAGYGLLLARDGLEAVEKALAYRPDLILMDINTPRLSGADAAARLRKAGFGSPIVALTASDSRDFDQSHFTASLRKPIQMPALLAEIKQQLR